MLREMLEIVREGREGYTPAELARRPDTSEGLVLQMLDDLERMGHLTRADRAAGGGCASCPLSGVCSAKTCASTATGDGFRFKVGDWRSWARVKTAQRPAREPPPDSSRVHWLTITVAGRLRPADRPDRAVGSKRVL